MLIGELCPFVGGNEYAYTLLAPLEYLVCGEDSAVRDKVCRLKVYENHHSAFLKISQALISIETVVSKLTEDQITRLFIPFLNRLANKDWLVTNFPYIYYEMLTIQF